MKITILGSGTSTGIPMVGCNCPVCTSTDPRDKRTRASLLVEHDGNFILVDTSTDLRFQAVREKIPKIDAVPLLLDLEPQSVQPRVPNGRRHHDARHN